jgi:DNA-binding CsgD family transcriptional regulator/tetratricopeptide (TPR) repeat protein
MGLTSGIGELNPHGNPINSGMPQRKKAAGPEGSAAIVSLLQGETVPVAWLVEAGVPEADIHAMLGEGVLKAVERPGHVRVREGACGAPAAGDLLESHARLAEAARQLRLAPELAARHYESAQQLRPARDCWLAAAEKACGLGDHHAALDGIRRALALWPWTEQPEDRLRVLKEQARCASNAGDSSSAASAWQEIEGYARDAGRPELQAEALRQLAAYSDDPVRLGECLERAAQIAEVDLPPRSAVPHLLARVEHLAGRMRIAAASEVVSKAGELALACGEPSLVSEVLGWQGLLAAMAGRHEEANERVRQSLRLALDHDLKEQAALAYRRQANICDYAGDYSGQRDHHHEAIRYCRTREVDGEIVCMSCLAYVCFRTGEWKEALSTARKVLSGEGTHPVLAAISHGVTGLIAAFRGERRVASRHLDFASRRLRIDGIAGLGFFCLWARAWLHQLDGETDGTTACYDEVRALWRESEDLHDVLPALLFACGHYADHGLKTRLADCLDIANSVSARNPIPEALAVQSAVRAEIGDGATDLLRQAADLFAKAGLPVERIWVECRILRHDPSRIADPSVLATATRLGLRPMLASLRATAGPVASELTSRQSDVLRGLAAGLTSKEIAGRLGLSVRTVEMHIARLMQRLDCRTRSEAVRVATRRGWV